MGSAPYFVQGPVFAARVTMKTRAVLENESTEVLQVACAQVMIMAMGTDLAEVPQLIWDQDPE